ncbi:MAG: neutral/alkaline non-lysosomal ceramidase N-terminal domain-containing protein [Armatimonadota bacterium]|nr:MAG: neutral/alkaline non-lysosomal ceramidase N-terminal domain-containing protein [Armatimonadota bacterium]
MKRVIWLAIIVALIGMLGLVAAQAGPLRAGAAAVDINVPEGAATCGYGDRAGIAYESIHDPIGAHALVLDDGNAKVAIVGVDVLGIGPEMRTAAVKGIAKTGIASDHLLLAATHTHSGPGHLYPVPALEMFFGKFRQDVLDAVTSAIVEAIVTADSRLEPAVIGAAEGTIKNACRNRRHDDGLIDETMSVIRVDAATGKPLAVVVNFAAHATVIGGEPVLISADFPRGVYDGVQRELGVPAIFFNGAQGDQSPGNPTQATGDRYARAKALGEALAAKALEIRSAIEPHADVTVTTAYEDVALPPATMPLMPKATGPYMSMAFDNALLVAVPGECISEIGRGVKDELRKSGKTPFFVGLANDQLGYILTEAEYNYDFGPGKEKGGYERTISLFGPKFGELTQSKLVELAEKANNGA